MTVDDVVIVSQPDPQGVHDFTMDDHGTPVLGVIAFKTTWGAHLKNVKLTINGEVAYTA